MTGILISVGVDNSVSFPNRPDWYFNTENDSTTTEVVSVHQQSYDGKIDNKATFSIGDVRMLGTVYGYRKNSTYHEATSGSAETVANLLEEKGLEGVASLNGEFCIAVIRDKKLHIVTDRLGSRPLYYWSNGGKYIIASDLLSVVENIPGTPALAPEYVKEYLAMGKILGCRTPFENIKKVPPATVFSVDLEERSSHSQCYWRPEFRPSNRSYSAIVSEFVNIFKKALAERLSPHDRNGVLLSAGSDSRLILAAANSLPAEYRINTFHMADWENKEAQTAEKVASTADVHSHQLLLRDTNYQFNALSRNPPAMNCISLFNQGHATGFHEEINERCDRLLSGQFADTFIKGHFLPKREIRAGTIGTFDLPLEHEVDTITEYIDSLKIGDNSYLDTQSVRETVQSEICLHKDGSVHNHGVKYPSMESMVITSNFWPLTNQEDFFFYRSLFEMTPHYSPFIDNRLIDFSLTVPKKHLLRKNIVNSAVQKLSQDLSDIPHATSGVPLYWPQTVHHCLDRFNAARWRLGLWWNEKEPPSEYYSHHPWPDHRSMLKDDDRFEEILSDEEDLYKNFDKLSNSDVIDAYAKHSSGDQNNREDIYRILTLIKTPYIK